MKKENITPLPKTDEIFEPIGGAQVFWKMDSKTRFHPIRVKRKYTEGNPFLSYGQFEYAVGPMSLENDPETFQLLRNNTCNDFLDACFVLFMEYLFIYRNDKESYYNHLYVVISWLQAHYLYISRKNVNK